MSGLGSSLGAPFGGDEDFSMTTLEDALRAWVLMATGLDDERVYFANQKVPRPDATGPFVTILIGDMIPLGLSDAVLSNTDLSRPAGQETEIRVEGQREVSASIQVWSAPVTTNGPAPNALDLANRIVMAASLPDVQAVFQAAKMSVFDFGTVRSLGALLGTAFEGRAQFDVRVYRKTVITANTTYIETVEIGGIGGTVVVDS